MKQIFAPWRIEWIRREDKNPDIEGCVFCELPELDNDRENLIIARSDHSYVMLNNYPYNPGHAMVIPRQHTGEYSKIEEDVLLDHSKLKQSTFVAIRRALEPDGFNTGLNLGNASGGSIDAHLHTHVVPRWEGDTNFMPVTGDTKVIVEALEDTYQHIHKAFMELDEAEERGEEDAVRVRF